MKYVEITSSEQQMTVEEFCKQIKDSYKKVFPKCSIITKLDKCRLDIIPLIGKLPNTVVKDLEDHPNKDFNSDKVYPDRRSFYIFLKNPHMEVEGEPKIVTKKSIVKNTLNLLPYSMSHVLTKDMKPHKSGIKKCKGTPQEVVKTLQYNFKTIKKELKDLLKQNLIYDEYIAIVKNAVSSK